MIHFEVVKKKNLFAIQLVDLSFQMEAEHLKKKLKWELNVAKCVCFS